MEFIVSAITVMLLPVVLMLGCAVVYEVVAWLCGVLGSVLYLIGYAIVRVFDWCRGEK